VPVKYNMPMVPMAFGVCTTGEKGGVEGMVFHEMRKRMKVIIIIVTVAFAGSLSYTGIRSMIGGSIGGRNVSAAAVATVNGDRIPWSDFQRLYFQNLAEQERAGVKVSPLMVESVKYYTLSSMIDQQLLLQETRDKKIKVDEDKVITELEKFKGNFPSAQVYRQQLKAIGWTEAEVKEAIEDQMKIQKLQENVIGDIEVTPEEIERAYEQVHARHILLGVDEDAGEDAWEKARQQAEDIVTQLRDGADFAELASRYSDDEATKDDGGDLGFFGRDRMVAEFEEAAFALNPGEISEPVKTEFGYHIINVVERKQAGDENFEEIKNELEQSLIHQKERERWNEWMQAVRDKADIVINDPQLRARRYWVEGETEKAILEYTSITQKDDAPYAHASLAQICESEGDYETAVEHYEKAVNMVPDDSQLQFRLGQALRRIGREDDAARALRRASDGAPNDLLLHIQLASIFEQMGLEEDAEIERGKVGKIQERLQEQKAMQEELEDGKQDGSSVEDQSVDEEPVDEEDEKQ